VKKLTLYKRKMADSRPGGQRLAPQQSKDSRWFILMFVAIVMILGAGSYSLYAFWLSPKTSSLSASANTGLVVPIGGIGVLLFFFSCCMYFSGQSASSSNNNGCYQISAGGC